MNIGHLTEQYLDAIVAKHGAKWSEDYRRRFAAMVAEVKRHRPPDPWTQKTKEQSHDPRIPLQQRQRLTDDR
jgi:hypothetical protein